MRILTGVKVQAEQGAWCTCSAVRRLTCTDRNSCAFLTVPALHSASGYATVRLRRAGCICDHNGVCHSQFNDLTVSEWVSALWSESGPVPFHCLSVMFPFSQSCLFDCQLAVLYGSFDLPMWNKHHLTSKYIQKYLWLPSNVTTNTFES